MSSLRAHSRAWHGHGVGECSNHTVSRKRHGRGVRCVACVTDCPRALARKHAPWLCCSSGRSAAAQLACREAPGGSGDAVSAQIPHAVQPGQPLQRSLPTQVVIRAGNGGFASSPGRFQAVLGLTFWWSPKCESGCVCGPTYVVRSYCCALRAVIRSFAGHPGLNSAREDEASTQEQQPTFHDSVRAATAMDSCAAASCRCRSAHSAWSCGERRGGHDVCGPAIHMQHVHTGVANLRLRPTDQRSPAQPWVQYSLGCSTALGAVQPCWAHRGMHGRARTRQA
jgi:hypothetical protein